MYIGYLILDKEFTTLKQLKYFDEKLTELFNSASDFPKTTYAVAYSKRRINAFKQDMLDEQIELDSIVVKELSSKFTSIVIDYFKGSAKKKT